MSKSDLAGGKQSSVWSIFANLLTRVPYTLCRSDRGTASVQDRSDMQKTARTIVAESRGHHVQLKFGRTYLYRKLGLPENWVVFYAILFACWANNPEMCVTILDNRGPYPEPNKCEARIVEMVRDVQVMWEKTGQLFIINHTSCHKVDNFVAT